MKNKKAKTSGLMVIFGICAVLVTLSVLYLVLVKPSATTPTTTTTENNVISGCGVEDTTITFSGLNKYTDAAAGGTHKYRVNGGVATSLADAGSATVSPGDSVEVLWANTSTTGNFGAVKTYAVPCKGTFAVSEYLVNNGSLTVRVFNEEGNIIDSAGENETVGAGDTANLNWEIQGDYQKEFPHGLVLVVEYNSSVMDDVVPSLGGATLTSATVPTQYAVTSFGAQSKKAAYLISPVVSNTKQSGTIALDSDDSNNPGSAYNGDVVFTFFPLNYYVNEDSKGAFSGPSAEDEDGAETRAGAITYTLQID